MIPATLTITPGQTNADGETPVSIQIIGTCAERSSASIVVGKNATDACDGNVAAIIGCALNALGGRLRHDDPIEWETKAENRGLPPHMLRVVVELDDLNTRLTALNSFIGDWPDNVNAKFLQLPLIDQTDLLEQQQHMAELAAVLHKRLQRAREAV